MGENETNLNEKKLEMLNAFFVEFNRLYIDFKEGNLNLNDYNFYKKGFIQSLKFCRIDLKNEGNESNNILLLNPNENDIITYPDWFKNNTGNGLKIESRNQKINLKVKCINDGNFTISLKGRDFRNYKNGRIPIHIFYKVCQVDNETILNNELTWHNEPFDFKKQSSNNDYFNIEIQFNTLFDFFPELLELTGIYQSESEIDYEFSNLEKYVENKNTLLNLKLEKTAENEVILEKLNGIANENYYINKRFAKLEKQIELMEANNKEVLDSYNLLFNSIFKYYELKPKKLFKYYKEITKQLLDFINNVCKKNNLSWWLYGGTLLGAYRHNGFIPWDDDCDIAMIRPDYEKFFDLFKEEINKNNLEHLFISRKTITSNNTFLPFIKLEYRVGGKLLGFIDIFPADYLTKVDDDIETLYRFEHKNLRKVLRNGADREEALNKAFESLNVSKTPTDKIISGVEDVVFSIVDYDTLFPLNVIKFEDRLYPCPNNTKKYVQTCYGDSFMAIPSVIKNHGFLQHIERWDDVYDLLEENINLLKEINAKFKFS